MMPTVLYATAPDGTKIGPSRGIEAACPSCGSPVLPKVGEIKAWHWAHRSGLSCDSEPETEWHLGWKSLAKPECVEVKIGDHRADIRRPDGWVIECQHSPISRETIRDRERCYGKVIWIFNSQGWHLGFRWKDTQGAIGGRIRYGTFRWKWPHRSLAAINGQLIFDREEHLLLVKKIHWHEHEYTDQGKPLCVHGWGIPKDRSFAKQILGEAAA